MPSLVKKKRQKDHTLDLVMHDLCDKSSQHPSILPPKWAFWVHKVSVLFIVKIFQNPSDSLYSGLDIIIHKWQANVIPGEAAHDRDPAHPQ